MLSLSTEMPSSGDVSTGPLSTVALPAEPECSSAAIAPVSALGFFSHAPPINHGAQISNQYALDTRRLYGTPSTDSIVALA